jgi:hypothetical protein
MVSWVIGNDCFPQKSIDFGCKAGISIPDLTSGTKDNPISTGYSSRLAADAAIHVEFHLSKRFSIQPQLEYSSQGGKKDGVQAFTLPSAMLIQFPPGQAPEYVYASYKSEAKINYLLLPVLAKYHFVNGKNWRTYVAAGPFVSLLLSAKNITKGSSNIYLDEQESQPLTPEPQSFDNNENIRKDLHQFNTGISGHVGISYQLANGILFIEGGGNYGLIDIQKDKTNGLNKTGAAVIDLGYQFRF